MTYPGYMALANGDGDSIELVNAARVKAYTDNLAPTMGLRGCDDCEALDDGYTTPAADNAPWYDPTDPATADFYGVYPLAFEGIDDSTRSIQSAELAGDGSIVVGSRFTGKDIRVSGMAFAKDMAALSAGVSWLDNALNGTEEGRCFGDRLNVFSSCPPVEVLPPNFAKPYEMQVGTPAQANAEAAQWTTTTGTIIGSTDGIRFDWVPGDAQKVACRQITGLIPGEQYQLRIRMEAFNEYYVRIGEECLNLRTNLATNPRLVGWTWSGAGTTDVEAQVMSGGPLGQGYNQAIITSANTSSPYSILPGPANYIPVTPGGLYQVSMYLRAPVGVARLSGSFRNEAGSTILSDARFDENVLTTGGWQRISGVLVAPVDAVSMEVFIAISVAAGQIQPNMEFGAANLLVESPNYDVQRTNYANDSRALSGFSWPFFAGTGGAVSASNVTGAADGPFLYGTTRSPTYRRSQVTTKPTGGSAGPLGRAKSGFNYPLVVPSGTPWVTGAFFRSNRTVSGTAYHRLLGATGNILAEFNQPFTLTANTWQYIVGGSTTNADIPGVEEAYIFLAVGGVGGGAAVNLGDVYDATGLLAQIGSAQTPYFDAFRPAEEPIAYIPLEFTDGDGSQQVLVADVGDYFDGYTPGYRWDGDPDESRSSTNQTIDFETIFGWQTSHDPDTPYEPTVLDFVPRTDSVALSITPTAREGVTSAPVLLVEDLNVRRTPRPGVLVFSTGYNPAPPSDGWQHLAPSGMSVHWSIGEEASNSGVISIANAPNSGTVSYTTNHGLARTLYGLRPGSRYRVSAEFIESWRASGSGATNSVNPVHYVTGATGAVGVYFDDVNANQHLYAMEFTAVTTTATYGIRPAASLSIGAGGDVYWEINEILVEEILPTDTSIPEVGRNQKRVMYEVKASQGPILTDVRRSPCGVMGRVSYSLRAGNPFKYRSPRFVGGLPAGAAVQVRDIPCSEDGLAAILNYHYNPSVEANTTDWSASGTGASGTRVSSSSAVVGSYVFRGSAPNTAGNLLDYVRIRYEPQLPATGPVLTDGGVYTVSVYFRANNSQTLGTIPWELQANVGSNQPLIIHTGTVSATVVNRWYRIVQTFTIPFGVSVDYIDLDISPPNSLAQGGSLDVDGYMLQDGDEATTAFDQTTPGVVTAGSGGIAAWVYYPSLVDISEDPQCPSPPAPPSPPLITNDCLSSPLSYSRTVVEVPASTVPKSLTAYPVITLTAGAQAVRQARIRFWENPDGRTIDDLDPCSFDGEIIVSYLAAGATMIIDGVLQQATVSQPGVDPQNANHLLYGPDGGPVDWPELTGGIPYLVTLELDAAASYADTIMLVDLVVRD